MFEIVEHMTCLTQTAQGFGACIDKLLMRDRENKAMKAPRP